MGSEARETAALFSFTVQLCSRWSRSIRLPLCGLAAFFLRREKEHTALSARTVETTDKLCKTVTNREVNTNSINNLFLFQCFVWVQIVVCQPQIFKAHIRTKSVWQGCCVAHLATVCSPWEEEGYHTAEMTVCRRTPATPAGQMGPLQIHLFGCMGRVFLLLTSVCACLGLSNCSSIRSDSWHYVLPMRVSLVWALRSQF